jgi:Protein of unknown function (DUF559)
MATPTLLPAGLADGPFLVSDALALGVSRDVLRGARFRSPFRGVRVPAHLPDSLELRCRAAALLLPPSAAFSHVTAVMLHGLPLPSGQGSAPDDSRIPLQATVANDPSRLTRPQPVGLVCHVARLSAEESVQRPDGTRVTTVARTWLDQAAGLDLVELVVLADAALRRRLTSPDELQRAVASWAGRPGAARLRQAVPLVEPATDSPMETRLRLLLVLAGLPRPVAGRDVVVDGGWLARPDLSYPDLRIAIEYDGDHHRADRRQWQNDIARRRLLEDAGWLVLVFTADDVLKRGPETVRVVHRALARRAAA